MTTAESWVREHMRKRAREKILSRLLRAIARNANRVTVPTEELRRLLDE